VSIKFDIFLAVKCIFLAYQRTLWYCLLFAVMAAREDFFRDDTGGEMLSLLNKGANFINNVFSEEERSHYVLTI
jgi:hypothetical protein